MSDQIDGNLIRHHLIWLEFLHDHDIKRSLCESHASKYNTIRNKFRSVFQFDQESNYLKL